MTRTGADSTVAAYLPEGRDIYLGYVDGKYRSYDQIKARFPHALIVPIATQASGDLGTVGDGPPDNGTWPEWIGWVRRRRAAGVDPTMYTDASLWAAGIQAFNNARVPQPHWWIAKWDDHAEVLAGSIGKQYQSVPGRYDLSLFADYWPGVDPAPAAGGGGGSGTTTTGAAAAAGTLTSLGSEIDMLLLESPNAAHTGQDVYLLSGDLYVHVPDGVTFTNLKKAGVASVLISEAMHQGITAAIAALEHGGAGQPGTTVTSTV